MRTPCCLLRFGLALVLLLFGMPAGATAVDATDTPLDSAGSTEQIWISSGLEMPAAPKTRTSSKTPEGFADSGLGGAGLADGMRPESVPVSETAAPGVSTPLYLSHCAFVC